MTEQERLEMIRNMKYRMDPVVKQVDHGDQTLCVFDRVWVRHDKATCGIKVYGQVLCFDKHRAWITILVEESSKFSFCNSKFLSVSLQDDVEVEVCE